MMKKYCLFILVLLSCTIFLSAQTPGPHKTLDFDGSNDFVDLNEPANLKLSAWTVMCWFKKTGNGTTVSTGTGGIAAALPLVTKGAGEAETPNNLNMNYALCLNVTGGNTYLAADFEELTGPNHPITGATVLQLDIWYHGAITYDGANYILYLNGVVDNSQALAVTTCSVSIQDNAIGAFCNSTGARSGAFNGGIDEAAVFNVALSQATIRDWMCKKMTASHPNWANLVGYWRMDDGSGTTVTDYSTGGNNGTATNFTGTYWVNSGAPVGNSSIHNYSSPASVTLTHANGDNLTVNTITGSPVGVQIYSITEAPDVTTPPSNCSSLETTRYWGVYVIGGTSPTYTAVYNWTGNPNATDPANHRLVRRDDGYDPTWASGACGTVNVPATTVTLADEKRGEYILGFITTAPAAMLASGNTLTFDGVNDWIQLGDPDELDLQYWTLECWFKRSGAGTIVNSGSVGTPDSEPLITHGMAQTEGGLEDYNFHLGIDQSALTPFIDFEDIEANGLNHNLQSSCAITNNRWYHLAATWNGTDLILYLDGVQRGISNLPGINCQYNSVQDVAIGSACLADGTNVGAWNGNIDEVRIWGTALSAATIRDYMCKRVTGTHPNYANLKGYWNFDASSGTTLRDAISCPGNDGVLKNFGASPWTNSGARLGDASTSSYGAPTSMTIVASDGSSMTANSIEGAPDGVQMYKMDGVPNVTTPPGGYAEVDSLRYYGVHMCGCNTYTYTAVYDYTGHPYVQDESNIDMGQRSDFSTASWTGLNATLNTSANTLTMTGRTGTEYVLLGRTVSALPIDLLLFGAKSVDNSYVKLEWETATETNSKQFTVERSSDALQFEPVAVVAAAGNSDQNINYTANDLKPYAGVSYYRLKQTDLNGGNRYSDIVSVSLTDDFGFSVYPNPGTWSDLNINIQGKKDAEVLVVVKDILGKEYYFKIIIPENDNQTISLTTNGMFLPSGVYIITASSNNSLYSRKLVVK